MTTSSPILFLVVLGGRTARSHVELHDVRWVVGRTIEDTIPALKQQWFGQQRGLHIDSYAAITHVDGWRIELVSPASSDHAAVPAAGSTGSLWFINLGAYRRDAMQEQHRFGLVVANSAQGAKRRARALWLKDALQVHKDDLHALEQLAEIDDCLPIETLGGWRIRLIPEPKTEASEITPDWFGYWRIDGRIPQPRPDLP